VLINDVGDDNDDDDDDDDDDNNNNNNNVSKNFWFPVHNNYIRSQAQLSTIAQSDTAALS